MKQTLTHKQLQILTSLYHYRFLHRHHIQQFLKNKNFAPINRYLTDLVNKNYIHRIYSKKQKEINNVALYYLSTKSVTLLKETLNRTNPELRFIYREKSRSLAFREQCLFTADMYFQFLTSCEENGGFLEFYTKNGQRTFEYFPHPKPTAYAVLKTPKAKTKRYFLEIINDDIPRFALRSLVLKYYTYYHGGQLQENTSEPFPKMLFVCPDQLRLSFLQRFIAKTRENEEVPLSFFLGLKSDIKERGLQENTWQRAE